MGDQVCRSGVIVWVSSHGENGSGAPDCDTTGLPDQFASVDDSVASLFVVISVGPKLGIISIVWRIGGYYSTGLVCCKGIPF
ncbi:MAG: hypothetical protein ACK5ME_04010 [Parahaliea sp.]